MTASGMMDCLPVAHRLADAARPIALHYFRSSRLGTDNKAGEDGGFDPVTLADRAIERAMRDILATERPDDGILGEEYDDVPSRSGVTWVLDPIDGTRAFLCGLPSWGVLIAANDGERPVIGIMDQPFIGERFTGILLPEVRSAVLDDATGRTDLAVRNTDTLSESLMCSTAPVSISRSSMHLGAWPATTTRRLARSSTSVARASGHDFGTRAFRSPAESNQQRGQAGPSVRRRRSHSERRADHDPTVSATQNGGAPGERDLGTRVRRTARLESREHHRTSWVYRRATLARRGAIPNPPVRGRPY